MYFEQLNTGACRTYLIGSERTKEAVLVDPVLPKAAEYAAYVRQHGFRLRAVIDSHTHADHLSAGHALRREPEAEYFMHANSGVQCVSRRLADGESLGIGEVTLHFVHVPGHTPDSLLILLGDRFLSGDFLFIGQGAAGRLDLPGGDIGAHHSSLRRLDALPDSLRMFPGHDYRGNTESTLGAERRANPILSPRSREEYLRWWESLRLGPADWMKTVLKANAEGTTDPGAVAIPQNVAACEACAPASGAAPGAAAAGKVPECSSAELERELAAGGVSIVDVREPEEYAGDLGHIRGAKLIPLGQLPGRATEVPPGPVVLVCRSGRRSALAAAELMKAGRGGVRSLAGGMEGWNEAEFPVEYSAAP